MSALPQPAGYEETPSMILPSLPPDVLSDGIDAAMSRAGALASTGREMHFVTDEHGALKVELRDLDGNVVKDVAPVAAVDALRGLGRL